MLNQESSNNAESIFSNMGIKDLESLFSNIKKYTVNYLPIISAYCNAIGLQKTINSLVDSKMLVQPGAIVQAMVLDTLSGRSPLYRLEEFMTDQDIDLFIGPGLNSSSFSDTNINRSMDAIFDFGSSKLLTEICLNASNIFTLDCSKVSYDTTATNVWGDYTACKSDNPPAGPHIVHGHSKDGHPELKQFMTELLCVERGIPIFGSTLDGNISDKDNNNTMLTRISKIMAKHGLGKTAFVYIADSAVVTNKNLQLLGNTPFITRFPENYKNCKNAIAEAVKANNWQDLGFLSELQSPKSRPSSKYLAYETNVEINNNKYRAIVMHSNAHESRMLKRLDKSIITFQKELTKKLSKSRKKFACRIDADNAANGFRNLSNKLYDVCAEIKINERPSRGRPPKNEKERKVIKEFFIEVSLKLNMEEVSRRREKAGCLVLLTNLPVEGENAVDAKGIFKAYKGQYGVESNFCFLKDPLIVNDLFLKKPSHIDVLGMVLIISLLIWRLMERTMRNYIHNNKGTLPGLNKQKTTRPTSYMMTTKFHGIIIAIIGKRRILLNKLDVEAIPYLSALGLDKNVFSNPYTKCNPIFKE